MQIGGPLGGVVPVKEVEKLYDTTDEGLAKEELKSLKMTTLNNLYDCYKNNKGKFV